VIRSAKVGVGQTLGRSNSIMRHKQIPEPWASFLSQVDRSLSVKDLARTIPFDLDAL
jgi:hypothetical protein